jgi:hypothetical protein
MHKRKRNGLLNYLNHHFFKSMAKGKWHRTKAMLVPQNMVPVGRELALVGRCQKWVQANAKHTTTATMSYVNSGLHWGTPGKGGMGSLRHSLPNCLYSLTPVIKVLLRTTKQQKHNGLSMRNWHPGEHWLLCTSGALCWYWCPRSKFSGSLVYPVTGVAWSLHWFSSGLFSWVLGNREKKRPEELRRSKHQRYSDHPKSIVSCLVFCFIFNV